MKYNYQNDPSWRLESMQVPDDKFGDYGCLITSIANIYQITSKMMYTPKQALDMIKTKNYFFTDGQGITSLLKTDDFCKELELKRENILNLDYENDEGLYYYAKVILGKYNHYINVIDNQNGLFICFDVLFIFASACNFA